MHADVGAYVQQAWYEETEEKVSVILWIFDI